MCQFKGTGGGKARLAGKSTHKVDGVGDFTGMTTVTSKEGSRKLTPVTEREAWAAGQKAAVRMLSYYRRKLDEAPDEETAQRIENTIEVIVGYSEYTQVLAEAL